MLNWGNIDHLELLKQKIKYFEFIDHRQSYNVFFRFMVVPGKNGANGETFSL
jgi:hypothetical protein